VGDSPYGASLANALISLQKSSGLWQFQAAVTYNTSSANALTLFYGGSMGRTGSNAITYMGQPVSDAPFLVNSQMFGAYDSFTHGNLSLVPEVQYIYAPTDHQVMIDKYTSNFGAALFTDYQFGTSDYSLGVRPPVGGLCAFVQYRRSGVRQ
jgi:hypothetical protein